MAHGAGVLIPVPEPPAKILSQIERGLRPEEETLLLQAGAAKHPGASSGRVQPKHLTQRGGDRGRTASARPSTATVRVSLNPSATASTIVDFPEPLSPTRKVTRLRNSNPSLRSCSTAGTVNGHQARSAPSGRRLGESPHDGRTFLINSPYDCLDWNLPRFSCACGKWLQERPMPAEAG